MTIRAVIADITTLDTDAIVNAANESLAPGGGVCGAIHRAAGPELALACQPLAPCPTGEARITPGFRLRARYVIHAVGPVWHGGDRGEAALLASAYRSSVLLAGEYGLTSIAFPAISTGIFGYPLSLAAQSAVASLRESLAEAPTVTSVVLACFDARTHEAFHSEIESSA